MPTLELWGGPEDGNRYDKTPLPMEWHVPVVPPLSLKDVDPDHAAPISYKVLRYLRTANMTRDGAVIYRLEKRNAR